MPGPPAHAGAPGPAAHENVPGPVAVVRSSRQPGRNTSPLLRSPLAKTANTLRDSSGRPSCDGCP
eukprot:7688631-Pyramimonas_sp.AAC.1